MVADLLAAMQSEEAAKLDAQHRLDSAQDRVTALQARPLIHSDPPPSACQAVSEIVRHADLHCDICRWHAPGQTVYFAVRARPLPSKRKQHSAASVRPQASLKETEAGRQIAEDAAEAAQASLQSRLHRMQIHGLPITQHVV